MKYYSAIVYAIGIAFSVALALYPKTAPAQEVLTGRGILCDTADQVARIIKADDFQATLVAVTGLRPSEVVNLQKNAIMLSASIPYVKILPDGRRLKTDDSQREIPLVGSALAAMKLRPEGFPRYRDKSSNLSATPDRAGFRWEFADHPSHV
jgi:integrase